MPRPVRRLLPLLALAILFAPFALSSSAVAQDDNFGGMTPAPDRGDGEGMGPYDRLIIRGVTVIDGTPMFTRVTLSTFGADCRWSLVASVPPGTYGVTATFQTLGFSLTGKLTFSNAVVVTIQGCRRARSGHESSWRLSLLP